MGPGVLGCASSQGHLLVFHSFLMSRLCGRKPGSDRTQFLFPSALPTGLLPVCWQALRLSSPVRAWRGSESASAGMQGDLCACHEEPHSAPPGRPERCGGRTPVVRGLVLPGDPQELVSSPGLRFQAPRLLSSVTLPRDLARVRAPHPSRAPFPAAASSPSLLTRF